MDSNNLNNDVIISVLNKLQNIMNNKETIEDEFEITTDQITIYDEDDSGSGSDCDTEAEAEAEAETETEAEAETETEARLRLRLLVKTIISENNVQENNLDVVISPKIEENLQIMWQKKEYLQLHLFIKDCNNKKNVKYIHSFLFNDTIKLNEKLDITSDMHR